MRRRKSKPTKAEVLNRAIRLWEHKQDDATKMLLRSAGMLLKLRKQRQRTLARLTTAMTKIDWSTEPNPRMGYVESFVARGMAAQQAVDIAVDDAIPGFLDRTGKDKDAAAREEIEAEQAAKKKRAAERSAVKRKIGQEIKHAELTGQRRKMPLTGKAALAAIHGK